MRVRPCTLVRATILRVQRSHTLLFVLTSSTACGSGPTGAKPAPLTESPVPPPVPVVAPVAPKPVVSTLIAPDVPTLTCETGAVATPAPFPDASWFCTRPDGTKHGPFYTLYPTLQIAVEGNYKHGKLDGAWKRRHPNGA